MSSLFTNGRFQAFDAAGVPVPGGMLYSYINHTTTPQATYTDATLGTPNTNPVVLNSRGEGQVWLGAGIYTLVLKDASGVTVWSVDGIQDAVATLSVSLAAATGASLIGWQQAGAGSVIRDVLAKLRDAPLTPSDFGALGDDTADDTTALKNALAATIAGRIARLERGKIYRIATDELVMQDYSTLDLNGAQLHFTVGGSSKRNLAVGNGCVVEGNGGYINNTSGASITDGTYQAPISVGVYTDTTSAKKNWAIRNLRINSLTPGGNGIAVIGSSHGVIENIDFGDSATMGNGILLHWSYDTANLNVGTGIYSGTTVHPHNVKIHNITAGTWNQGAGGSFSVALVFISGSYNVEVSNVTSEWLVHGVGCHVYPGDWGFRYGSATEQVMGMCGIDVARMYGRYLIGVNVYGKDDGTQATAVTWPASIVIDNVNVRSNTVQIPSQGFRLEGSTNVTIKSCTIDNFDQGARMTGGNVNLTIKDSLFRSCELDAIDGSAESAGAADWVIDNNQFVATSRSASLGTGVADIHVTQVTGLTITRNTFNSGNADNNVLTTGTVTRLKAMDNHTYSVSPTGPCYLFGSSGNTNIVKKLEGNTSDATPSAGMYGGQVVLPVVVTMRNGSIQKPVIAFADAMPTAGTWDRGSVVYNNLAAASGIPGWVRITSGSGNVLHTDWVTMAALGA